MALNIFRQYLLLSVLFVCLPYIAFAQVNKNHVYTFVEKMPKFDGDMAYFLGKHTELPEGVEENCVTGTVLVGFIVNEDGSVDSVQALYGPHPVLEKVSVQAIKKSSGRWKPGSFHDTTVRVRMTQLMTYNFPSCPDDSYYYNLGVASFKKGELETARKYFSRAYAMNFRNLDAVFNWAVTNIKLGDLTNACEKFRDLNARGYPKAQEYLDSYCR